MSRHPSEEAPRVSTRFVGARVIDVLGPLNSGERRAVAGGFVTSEEIRREHWRKLLQTRGQLRRDRIRGRLSEVPP